jgi:hypothetical protein
MDVMKRRDAGTDDPDSTDLIPSEAVIKVTRGCITKVN